MTKADEIMNAAIAHSTQRCNELNSVRACGWVESPIGTIYVSPVVATGVQTFREAHIRYTWKLNTKRISADKLKVLLNA